MIPLLFIIAASSSISRMPLPDLTQYPPQHACHIAPVFVLTTVTQTSSDCRNSPSDCTMEGHWLLLQQSAETEFSRECVLRRLRAMNQDQLLETAERLAENIISYGIIIKQAATHIARLEAERLLADAGPFPPPADWQLEAARHLMETGPADRPQ